MTKRSWLSHTNRIAIGLCFLSFFAASASYGATVAYWDFETDLIAGSAVDGQTVSHPNGSGSHDGALADIAGNGNTLSAWNDSWASMAFSSNVASSNQTGSTLSVTDTSEYSGFSTVGDLDVGGNPIGSLATWTIEASVYYRDVSGWQGIVGVDGNNTGASDPDRAPLYFQNVSGSNLFRINYVDAAGNSQSIDSTTVATTGTWYHVAATNDGDTLRMYVNGQEESSLDLTGSADSTFIGFDENQIGGDIVGWSVMRGMYDGSHGDRMRGNVDDVRISDAALLPDDFLNLPPISMVAEVDTTSGEVTLRNVSDAPISFDYYLLQTENNTLDPTNWDSLDDQSYDVGLESDFDGSGGPVDGDDLAQWQADFGLNGGSDADGDGDSDGRDFLTWQRQKGQGPGPGDSWDEAGGSDSSQLAEFFLNGNSILDPNESVSIGNAFDYLELGSGVEDDTLLFQYGEAGGASLSLGGIVFLGTSSEPAAAAVPEPSALAMGFWLAAGALAANRRRRQSRG